MSLLVFIGVPGAGKRSIVGQLSQYGYMGCDVETATAARLHVPVSQMYLECSAAERATATVAVLEELYADIRQAPDQRFCLALPPKVCGCVGEKDEVHDPYAALRAQLVAQASEVIWLQAELSTLMTRNALIGMRSALFIMPRKEFRLLSEAYAPIFEELSTAQYDTTHSSVAQATQEILEQLHIECEHSSITD
ncbi:hypothetical protein [Trueperella sp. LYQ141]|uniref:hypothetical protein n=1 Tax=Trueperella sp. LYQ141 TaxID=3391058 RepID=UPI003982D712